MYIKRLASWRGYRLDLHKFVRADDSGCFHTHPAKALRFVLYGGYVEQVESGGLFVWGVGDVGIIRPEFCHRVHAILNGRVSYSLWIRGPITHDVELRGNGWSHDAMGGHSERN